MKDHVKERIGGYTEFSKVKTAIDDYMDYYNNHRYQWELAKLASNEFYQFYTTGVYPLDIPTKPEPPSAEQVNRRTGSGNGVKGQYAGCGSVQAALDRMTRTTLLCGSSPMQLPCLPDEGRVWAEPGITINVY